MEKPQPEPEAAEEPHTPPTPQKNLKEIIAKSNSKKYLILPTNDVKNSMPLPPSYPFEGFQSIGYSLCCCFCKKQDKTNSFSYASSCFVVWKLMRRTSGSGFGFMIINQLVWPVISRMCPWSHRWFLVAGIYVDSNGHPSGRWQNIFDTKYFCLCQLAVVKFVGFSAGHAVSWWGLGFVFVLCL